MLKSACVDHGRVGMAAGYATAFIAGKSTTLHRKVFLDSHGYLPEIVRHTCDNPRCININHLLAGTQVDNMRDMRERDRGGDSRNFGSANGRTVLSSEDVAYMRAVYVKHSKQYGLPALSRRFGVGVSQVFRVIKGVHHVGK